MEKQHNDNNNADQQVDNNPLMACYNGQPPQPEQPARFYWQEPWREATGLAADDAVQAAFEN
jgi:hypothetical protein